MHQLGWEASRLSTSSSEYSIQDPKPDRHGTGTTIVRSHDGWTIWRHWIHIVAVLVTAGLATINLLNIYLMDLDFTTAATVLNSFQFAAKLHEVLIVGSLMLVLMDMVRGRLLTPTGVPLGFLLSPTLFNDLDWLTSPHFWAAMKPSSSSLPLVALVFFSIPFANIAGPLSAIVVVPRLGWSQSKAAAIYPSFFNSSAANIWPTNFAASALKPICFTGAGDSKPCPANAVASLDVMFNPEIGGPLLCTSTGSAVSCNSSIGEQAERDLAVEYNSDSLTSYSSTPPPLMYELIASRVASGFAIPLELSDTEVIDTQKTQLIDTRFVGAQNMLKPISNVTCLDLDYSQIYETFQTFNVVTDWSTPFLHWLSDVDKSSQPNVLFTYLRNDSKLDASTSCNGQECYAATSCSISAFWAPVQIWHNSAQTSLLFHSDPQPKKLFNSKVMDDAIPITIKKDWLETFTTPLNRNISRTVPTLLNAWGTQMRGGPKNVTDKTGSVAFFNPGNYSQALSVLISSLTTEALGRSTLRFGDSLYNGNCSNFKAGFSFSPEICAETPSHWIHATDLEGQEKDYVMAAFTVRRNGYGWFVQNITVKIALGILLLHGLLTLVYLVVSLAFRRTVTTCWSSAPEMLMLAIDSLRAPVLMGSSAKARHKSLWREPVSVMEVDNGERVSLIVGDPYSYPERLGGPPVLGKKYQ